MVYKKHSQEAKEIALSMWTPGADVSIIAQQTGISSCTLYRCLESLQQTGQAVSREAQAKGRKNKMGNEEIQVNATIDYKFQAIIMSIV
jgi:transposase